MLYLLVQSSNKLNKLLVFICQPKILKMLKFTELKQKMVWNGSGCSSTSDFTPTRFDLYFILLTGQFFRWRHFALPFYGESYHSLFPLSEPNSSVYTQRIHEKPFTKIAKIPLKYFPSLHKVVKRWRVCKVTSPPSTPTFTFYSW